MPIKYYLIKARGKCTIKLATLGKAMLQSITKTFIKITWEDSKDSLDSQGFSKAEAWEGLNKFLVKFLKAKASAEQKNNPGKESLSKAR